ncbi:hypothetical protein [Fictibacillus gelatini]|uniref:hypothetical protein n=1 Tax=Fictibacillus gelatini TaxID=225985 RepID=UPI0003F8897E|nr:hypothetical protein [Fictibacillus gelatini]
MESFKWNEEQIQKQLENMPPIKDRQSKERVFQQVKSKLEESERKKRWVKTRVVPTIATACVVVMISVLIPVNHQSNQSSSSKKRVEDIKGFESSGMDTPHDLTKNGKLSLVSLENKEQNSNSFIKNGERYHAPILKGQIKQPDQAVVTIAYLEREMPCIVPVSFLVKDKGSYVKNVKQVLTKFKPETVGLDTTILNKLSFKEDGNTIVVDIPSGEIRDKKEAALFEKLLEYTFAYNHQFTKAKLMTNGKPGITIGDNQRKREFNLDLVGSPTFVMQTDTGDEFLVNSYGTNIKHIPRDFKNALNELKYGIKDERQLSPVIPKHIKLGASGQQSSAVVSFHQKSPLKNNMETRKMLDAIVVTAKAYGHKHVQFKNTGVQKMGPYRFNRSIDETVGINYVEAN